MIGVRERTVTFHMNGEKVMFDAKPTPHYPKEMVGCFIVQVLDRGEEAGIKMELLNESTFSTFDARVIEYMYDFPYFWDEKIVGCENERLNWRVVCHYCGGSEE